MSMPRNLILIRHGESEGNIVSSLAKIGDVSVFTDEFMNRHSSLWRLTDKGKDQAKIAGDWMKENIRFPFFRFYTSEYVRAMETAALLNIEDASWYSEFYLRERNWGDMDRITPEKQQELFKDSMKEKKIEPLYWTPPNGESLADVGLRVDRIFQTLHRECEDMNVVIVCHGEVMWMIRSRLERLTQERFKELNTSKKETDQIHNCQIMMYTRENPEDSNDIRKYLKWSKSVCPWDEKLSDNKWNIINIDRYSNDDLLKRVEKSERLIN